MASRGRTKQSHELTLRKRERESSNLNPSLVTLDPDTLYTVSLLCLKQRYFEQHLPHLASREESRPTPVLGLPRVRKLAISLLFSSLKSHLLTPLQSQCTAKVETIFRVNGQRQSVAQVTRHTCEKPFSSKMGRDAINQSGCEKIRAPLSL